MSDIIEKDLFASVMRNDLNQIDIISVKNPGWVDSVDYPRIIPGRDELKMVSNDSYTVLYSYSNLYIFETDTLYFPNDFSATAFISVSLAGKHTLSFVLSNNSDRKNVKHYFGFFNILNRTSYFYQLEVVKNMIELYFYEYSYNEVICFIDKVCMIINTDSGKVVHKPILNFTRVEGDKILQISKHIYVCISLYKLIIMNINGKNIKETKVDRINTNVGETNYTVMNNKEIIAQVSNPNKIIKITIDVLHGKVKTDELFDIKDELKEDGAIVYDFKYDRESKTLAMIFKKGYGRYPKTFVYINGDIRQVNYVENKIAFVRIYTKEKKDRIDDKLNKNLRKYTNSNILGIIKKFL